MTGFDPSKFVDREAAREVAEVDDVDFGFDDAQSPPRRGAASASQGAGSPPLSSEPPAGSSSHSDTRSPGGSIGDPWDTSPPAVAGVATVAALGLEYPHAADLNRMFDQPPPDWLRATLWARLLADARKFVASGKCATALELGWEPIELFAFDRIPWRRYWHGRQVWGTLGLIGLLRGRGIGEIEAHRIEIINRIGAHERLYRATAVMNRPGAAFMWEAFDPANQPPPNARLLQTGEIVDGTKYQPP